MSKALLKKLLPSKEPQAPLKRKHNFWEIYTEKIQEDIDNRLLRKQKPKHSQKPQKAKAKTDQLNHEELTPEERYRRNLEILAKRIKHPSNNIKIEYI